MELYVIIQVGSWLGAGPTLALLLLVSVAGAWLVKHEGLQVWARFRSQLDRGVVPEDTRRLAEAAGGEALIVPEAQHLGAIKVANLQVIELALRTFAAATI